MSPADATKRIHKGAGESHYAGVMEKESSTKKRVCSAATNTHLKLGELKSIGVANLLLVLEIAGEFLGMRRRRLSFA